jgi:hypothetical protein
VIDADLADDKAGMSIADLTSRDRYCAGHLLAPYDELLGSFDSGDRAAGLGRGFQLLIER